MVIILRNYILNEKINDYRVEYGKDKRGLYKLNWYF